MGDRRAFWPAAQRGVFERIGVRIGRKPAPSTTDSVDSRLDLLASSGSPFSGGFRGVLADPEPAVTPDFWRTGPIIRETALAAARRKPHGSPP